MPRLHGFKCPIASAPPGGHTLVTGRSWGREDAQTRAKVPKLAEDKTMNPRQPPAGQVLCCSRARGPYLHARSLWPLGVTASASSGSGVQQAPLCPGATDGNNGSPH